MAAKPTGGRWDVKPWRCDYREIEPGDKLGRGGLHVILRHSGDPERSPRSAHTRAHGTYEAFRLRKKSKPEWFIDSIYDLLLDGKPRSFNAISVELLDKTADITCGSAFEEALWQLVIKKHVKWALIDNGAKGALPMIFTVWLEGEYLHENCEECMAKELPVLHGPWSYTRATMCAQAHYWDKVEELGVPGRPDDLWGIDRTKLGHAKHTGAEKMMQGLKERGQWPVPKKIASWLLRQEEYSSLGPEALNDIEMSMALFKEKFVFDMDLRLGAEVEFGMTGDLESCNFWDAPPDGWRARIDWAQVSDCLEVYDYKNRPAMFNEAEIRDDMQVGGVYPWIISQRYPTVRNVDELMIGIYYFEFGVHQRVKTSWEKVDENVERLKKIVAHKERMKKDEIVPEPGFGKCQYCDYLMICDAGQAEMKPGGKRPVDHESAVKLAKWLFVEDEKVKAARAGMNAYTKEVGPVMLDEETGFGHALTESKEYDARAVVKVLTKAKVDLFSTGVLKLDKEKLKKVVRNDEALTKAVDKLWKPVEKTKFQAFRAKKKKAVKVEPKSVKGRVRGKGRKNGEE